MPRQIAAPRHGEPKDFPLRIHEDVAFDLHVYCEAIPAQWTRVINRAVRELIDRELAANPGIRDRFERLREQLLEKERLGRLMAVKENLRVIDRRIQRKRRNGPRR